jgi:alpha-tubulin suppressor-like RCC1 family protein
MNTRNFTRASTLALFGLAGCVGNDDARILDPGDPNGPDSSLGSAVAAITSVPTGVACIQLVLSGSVSATNDFTVVGNSSSASLSLGPLPAGSLTVQPAAFNVACSAIVSSTVATWVGAATTVTITPGLTTQIALTLRQNVPVSAGVNFLSTVKSIAAGAYASYAVLTDGTVRSWGNNGNGQLGDGMGYSSHTKPGQVLGINSVGVLTNIVSVAGGVYHACALRDDGAASCWGYNVNGALGNNTFTSTAYPVAVSGSLTFTQLAAGTSHSCGITTTPSVVCWGSNTNGQMGNSGIVSNGVPVTATAFSTVPDLLTAGGSSTLAYYGNTGLGVGANATGLFGNGVSLANNFTAAALGFDNGALRFITAVSAGQGQHACAVEAVTGNVYCAGTGTSGELGNGATTNQLSPVRATGLSAVTSVVAGVQHSCALRSDQSVWCWGGNSNGELGVGTGVASSTPVQVVGLSGVTSLVAGSSFTCALKSDGTVWCWGANSFGQLGDGTAIKRALPVQVQL